MENIPFEAEAQRLPGRDRRRMQPTDVGTTLRNAREQHGLSLADVAERTNISKPVLEAIERNALDEIPGGLFTRGYLRAFAAEVGVDGEQLVLTYLESQEPIDVLDELRARFHILEHEGPHLIQFLLVIACVAGLLFLLLGHDSGGVIAVDAEQELSPLHDAPSPDGVPVSDLGSPAVRGA